MYYLNNKGETSVKSNNKKIVISIKLIILKLGLKSAITVIINKITLITTIHIL
jgi:hypothetical protein